MHAHNRRRHVLKSMQISIYRVHAGTSGRLIDSRQQQHNNISRVPTDFEKL